MSPIVQAIRGLLLSCPEVTGRLATYEFTTGQPTPAIFAGRGIPDDAGLPAIILAQVAALPFGAIGIRGMEASVDISVYGNRDGNYGEVYEIAEGIWRAVDRGDMQPHLPAGWGAWDIMADPPRVKPDPDNYPGYVITAKGRVAQNV